LAAGLVSSPKISPSIRNRAETPLNPRMHPERLSFGADLLDALRGRFAGYAYVPIVEQESKLTHAVLVPFYLREGELHIVLTKRTDLVSTQQGHIAFPGGRREPDDPDLRTTALRESWEEIGLEPADVEVFGRLDDFWTHGGKTFVAGFVGLIDPQRSPYPWRPQQSEVAEMLEVPVRHLLEPRNVEVAQPREVIGRMWPNETFVFRGHRIFGATARTLRHVLNIAHPVLAAGT
jgi:8-oxo-dGTP pyrophosphatase MutT (NUDIX family)